MSRTPTISVLVPVRDGAAFLSQAIESLQAQAFADWEALLCPVEQSPMPAHAADRIRIIDATAASTAEAIAIAASQAGGNFLCVLDGDDVLDPTALSALLAAFEVQPGAGMAYSRHVLIDGTGKALAPGPLCDLPYSPEALLLDFMTGPLQLVRRDAWTGVGGYNADHPDAADYDLCLRLSETWPIAHVPQALYRKRVHARSPAVLRWAEQIEDRYRAFVAAVHRRGLDATYDCALEIDSWHILQPLRPFGGAGNWH